MRTMSVTIEEQLYHLLKKTAGPRGMSKFIAQALKDRLDSSQHTLYQEYLAASTDPDRQEVLRDWDGIDTESWS
jgi:hypothetical protein